MRQLRLVALVLCLFCLLSPTALAEDAGKAANLFDPERHMRIAEVKPGMKGFGLSVFSGTKIERFDVEVISVLRNFNPRHDVVLIRCSGANMEHTGAISGMSGSPIYLTDESGKDRMIGALAYGWPLLKDPLAGVQPIEYMLEVPVTRSAVATTQPASGGGLIDAAAPAGVDAQRRSAGPWKLSEVMPLPSEPAPRLFPFAGIDSVEPNPAYFGQQADSSRLAPLTSPLMVAGVPSNVLDAYSPVLRASGLIPLQAGGGGSPQPDAADQNIKLEPGSVMAVPLVTGDVDITAIGTVTEVIGGHVFGFGHPFVNEGPTALPMGTGQINGVLARLDQSMKLGSLVKLQGAVLADHTVGIVGEVGDSPATAPIELRVVYEDGSQDVTYRFDCSWHPRLTPLLGAMALSAATTAGRELPQYHTLRYDLSLEFANGQTVRLDDVMVNTGAAWAIQSVPILRAATENPFERVPLKRITGTVRITPEAREARILSVNVPRLKYKPGETVRAFVRYRPFRAPEAVLPIDFELPHDLRDGNYQLIVGGRDRYFRDEMMAQPFRLTAESADEVFATLRDVASLRHDAMYVRLLRQPDGIAVGRVAMPRMPSSRRQVMISAGRSNITPFVTSTVKTIPTQLVIEGEAEFAIEIDADERVEVPAKAASPDQDSDE